jgi:hypothetical protein
MMDPETTSVSWAAVWFFVSLIGLWLVLVNAFVAVVHAKAIFESDRSINWFFKWPVFVLGVLGVVLDVTWNWTIGCLIFRELPRKITFTSRCGYHKKHSGGWRQSRAQWWCDEMSKFDPGHC